MVTGNLIAIARSRLGDDNKQRWTDFRLLTITSQAQANICKLSGIYRKEAYIALANGEHRYQVPSNCMVIRRIENKDINIPLVTRDDLDNSIAISTDFVCVKDNLGMGWLDVYPTPSDIETDIHIIAGDSNDSDIIVSPEYGVTSRISEGVEVAPVYGIVTGITVDLDPSNPPLYFGEVTHCPENNSPLLDLPNGNFGVVIAAEYIESDDPKLLGGITDSDIYQITGQFGVTTSITPKDNTLRVFYEAVPEDLSSFQSHLVIPDMWEEAMIRYIVGTALQDDNDAANIQRGESELSKYTGEVAKARELASKDFSGGTKNKYHTRYRSI